MASLNVPVARLVDRSSLLPDELLHSFIGRLVLLNALPRPQDSLRTLLGGHQPVAGIELPHGVATLDAALGRASPGADHLLERATLLPYYRAFLPDGRAERILARLMDGSAVGLKAAMGLAANRFGAFTVLRYCPQCAREDHFLQGKSYWRRAHHLPGVQVCSRHGLSLVRCSAPSRSGNKQALLHPPCNVQDFERGPQASASQARFAHLSAHALQTSHRPPTHAHRAAVYQKAVKDSGFMGARSLVDYGQLATALLQHHENFHAFEHRSRLLATDRTPLAWLRPLLTRPERALHPICHLVLIDFLFGSWHAYEAALRAQEAQPGLIVEMASEAPSRTVPAVPGPILDPALTCTRAAQLTGLCVTTVATHRRAAGLTIASRPKAVCGPLLERVRKLVCEGLSPALIAERTGVSMSTAYRVRRVHRHEVQDRLAERQHDLRQAHRRAWLDLASQNLSVKGARERLPSCYAWLYRNDREWLVAANATFAKAPRPRTRLDWSARDREWSCRVEALACAWYGQHPRSRLSPSALARGLGQWTVRAHRHKLPQVAGRIAEIAQTRMEFQHARMTEAIASMKQDGIPIVRWRLAKRAGLRELPRPIPIKPLSTANPSHADAGPLSARPPP